MARHSPLRERHEQAQASFLHFGEATVETAPDAQAAPIAGNSAQLKTEATDTPPAAVAPPAGADVVDTFGNLEAEYAAIRKGCVLIDQPHRGTVIIRGSERLDFLNRMLTQELAPGKQPVPPFTGVRTFWLNRKGRIDADIRLVTLPDARANAGADAGLPEPFRGAGIEGVVFDLDILSAAHTARTLEEFVFAEDVAFEDATERFHRFAVHGPAAARLVADHATHLAGDPVDELSPGRAAAVEIAGVPVLVDRQDCAGEIGLQLLVPIDHAVTVFDELAQHARSEHGHLNDAEARPGVETYKLRHAGWHALNIARIEAGTPVFRVDFGPTNLPAETGVLHDRVSFTKGCYLGQEVVARMHSLGHPKQTLAALRITRSTTAADGTPDMPMTGSTIFPAAEGPDETDDAARTPADDAKPVGAVTSATRSPMLGDEPVCFAMLKWKHHEPGTPLLVQTGSGFALATVNDGLRLWGR